MGLVGEDAGEQTGGGGGGNKKRGAKQLEGVWRDWAETASFGPRVEVLSLDEMDRVEALRDRAMRCIVVYMLPLEGDGTDIALGPQTC